MTNSIGPTTPIPDLGTTPTAKGEFSALQIGVESFTPGKPDASTEAPRDDKLFSIADLPGFANYNNNTQNAGRSATIPPQAAHTTIAMVDTVYYGFDHIGLTSYIAENSSTSAADNVVKYNVKDPSIDTPIWMEDAWGHVANSIDAANAAQPRPDVVNISLGGNPSRFFEQARNTFRDGFIKENGPQENWDADTQSRYKDGIAKIAQQAVDDFNKLNGAIGTRLRNAISDLVKNGVTVTIAAGNEGGIFKELSDLGLPIPKGFDQSLLYDKNSPPGVIVVGGSQSNEATPGANAAGFTAPNDNVDVAADATDLAVPGGTVSGTSGAAPEVAGLVADMRAVNPSLTPAQIESIIKQTATATSDDKRLLGSGIINREAALSEAARLAQSATDTTTSTAATTGGAANPPAAQPPAQATTELDIKNRYTIFDALQKAPDGTPSPYYKALLAAQKLFGKDAPASGFNLDTLKQVASLDVGQPQYDALKKAGGLTAQQMDSLTEIAKKLLRYDNTAGTHLFPHSSGNVVAPSGTVNQKALAQFGDALAVADAKAQARIDTPRGVLGIKLPDSISGGTAQEVLSRIAGMKPGDETFKSIADSNGDGAPERTDRAMDRLQRQAAAILARFGSDNQLDVSFDAFKANLLKPTQQI